MPVPSFRCAVASAERREPIFATASQVRRWLLVEIRGSWGADSVWNTDLGRHVSTDWCDQMRSEGVRVVAIRRDLDIAGHPLSRLFVVESGTGPWRSGRIWRRDVAGLHTVLHATARLPFAGEVTPGWSAHDESLVLVCTNGRHDACCAVFGRPLVRALRESAHTDAVWECSHIGGDRFAGNIVILPDGLYFGRCDPVSGVGVVDAYGRGELDGAHYRGRSGLGYMHQAAEFLTRREMNAFAIDAVASVRRVGLDGRFDVVVRGMGTARVTVRRHRGAAPSPLTCTGPNDVTLPSYELVALVLT